MQEPINHLEAFFGDTASLLASAKRAVREAVRRHKLLNESIVVWRDGKVVVVPAEEIEIDELQSNGVHHEDQKP